MNMKVSVPDDRLAEAYEAAWQEWDLADDAELWESTAGDGLNVPEGCDST